MHQGLHHNNQENEMQSQYFAESPVAIYRNGLLFLLHNNCFFLTHCNQSSFYFYKASVMIIGIICPSSTNNNSLCPSIYILNKWIYIVFSILYRNTISICFWQ